MATYVNNLRLKEITTGDESGTWGTSTNTNLELVGEALGFGTEAITTNADTHTTTIADGSSDAGRAFYIKYTGTLDSACTITIGPNTMKRVHVIENGTSGSQNILISQGSGANITIAPGKAKAVYLDGAGSGAAVVDAFAHLSVVDLTVDDDLIVTDDASIGGRLTVDDATDATSTTDGSLQTDGGLSVAKDGIFGNDVKLKSDSAVLAFGNDNDITLTHAADTGLTCNGTFAATTVTANGGLVADNITIDGTEIDLSSGDLTLDVAGDIILNADGGDLIFQDGSTTVAHLTNSSSDFVIEGKVADKDLIFKGLDDSSVITALTLDISAAGAATFNNDVTAFSDKRLKTDISNIDNALDKVMRMQGVYYKRNDIEDARTQVGVLAQDMEAILPEVVLTADDEIQTKSVDYGKICAVLIEAIKDLKAEINELKGR